ncbi:MAG: Flp pilus assembly protein CpaB [Beijerinckiaceae bacterium]|nr:Flp pilus assembly protein CpaB [Beijerinckiaceae bacterium]
MKLNTLLLLLGAIVFGGIAAYFSRQIIMARPADPRTTLVVASEPLGFGSELTSDNLSEITWSSTVVPAGAYATKADLLKEGRRVALAQIEANEPVLASRITGPGEKGALSALIDPKMRAVTVRVDDVRGVGGFVTPGDRVDVVLTRYFTKTDEKESFADVLLQNVKVLGVDQIANATQEKASVAKAVTVEVSTEQAQKLVLAQGVGSLSLVLRKAGAADALSTRRVTSLDLGEGEVVGSVPGKQAAPPNASSPPPPVVAVQRSATVRVFRGTKPQEYSVHRHL